MQVNKTIAGDPPLSECSLNSFVVLSDILNVPIPNYADTSEHARHQLGDLGVKSQIKARDSRMHMHTDTP